MGIRRFRPRGGHQNSPFRGKDYKIPYMVGKLAPNSTHSTTGLVKYVPGRSYFRAVPSQNGDKFVTSPPPQFVSLLPPTSRDNVHPYRHDAIGSVPTLWDHAIESAGITGPVFFKVAPVTGAAYSGRSFSRWRCSGMSTVVPIVGVGKVVHTKIGGVQRLGRAGVRRFRPRGGHQNRPFRG